MTPVATRALGRAAIVGLLCFGMASCATARRVWPFNRDSGPQATASAGERVSIIQFDQEIAPNAALAAAGFQLPAPRPVTSWSLPGGTPEQSIEHADAAPAFQVAWRSNAGEGSSRTSQVTSPVVAADGRIYVMDGESRVSAFDAATGAQVWRTSIRPEDGDRTAFGGGLATFGGKVFATSGFRVVAALDAATGAVAWSTPVESPIHSAPTVSAGRVYAIDVDNQLIALDVNTGALAWSSQAIVEPARILRASSPAVSGDAILAPFSSGELIALRAANGQQLWQQVLSRTNRTNALSEIRDVAGRPVISRGVAYAGSHSGLFAAVDMRTGQRKWELPIATVNAAWVAGDVVYVLSNTGQVICISRDTGQVYWIHELNENRGERRGIPGFGRRTVRPVWSGPLLANNRLILVNNEGEAVTLDARTGAEQAQINLGSAAYIAPIAYNGMVYVLTDEAKLVAIR